MLLHMRWYSETPEYLLYDALARHLASHGYIVVSVSRDAQAFLSPWKEVPDESAGFLIPKSIEWLYNSSPYKTIASDRMAVIGHSSGGRIVIDNLSSIKAVKQISGLVLLASCFSYTPYLFTLPNYTKAFLLMGASHGTDPCDGLASKPPPNEPKPIQSVFGLYDVLPNEVSKTSIYFARKGNLSYDAHNFQNSPVCLAYVTAWLGQHLKGLVGYAPVFKLGEPAGSLTPPEYLALQHHEPDARKVIDFNEPNLSFVHSPPNIDNVKVNFPWVLNRWGSPAKRVLQFRLTGGPSFWSSKITLSGFFPVKLLGSGYKYFVYRIGQVYDVDKGNTSGTARPLWIRLGPIHVTKAPSVPFAFTSLTLSPERHKTVLATYVIPFADFNSPFDLPLVNLYNVELDFGIEHSGPTYFMLGDIELWK